MTVSIVARTTKTGDLIPASFPAAFLSDGTTPDASVHALVDATKTLINPATREGQGTIAAALAGLATDAEVQAVVAKIEVVRALLAGTLTVGGSVALTNLPATQPVSLTSAPLPAGASTEATLAAIKAALQGTLATSTAALPLPAGAASEATLAGLKSAVQAQIDLASTLWTDSSGAFYVRRDVVNESTGTITVAFTDPQGAAAVPGAGLKPATTTASRTMLQAIFDAVSDGAGYGAGDLIGRVTQLDTSTTPATVTASLWLNLSTGAILAGAPSAGTISEQTKQVSVSYSALPAGAASEASLLGLRTLLSGTLSTSAADGANGTLGSRADAAWDGQAAAPTEMAVWKYIADCVASPLVAGSKVGLDGSGLLPSGVAPVTGTFAATGRSASFAPLADRAFNVTLWGVFAAEARLERSFDEGATWFPLTAAGQPLYDFTAPASEVAQEAEAGVLYSLNCTSFTSGTINYRVSQ